MEGAEQAYAATAPPEWVTLEAEPSLLAAPHIHGSATSERVPTGLWRTLRPVIEESRCNRCWWICSTLCPDAAIDVDAEQKPSIDYEHCKGCMICVSVCPAHAIRVEPEAVISQLGRKT